MFEITILLASLGMIFAVVSFISGLQVVKSKMKSADRRIHRYNGYIMLIIYVILAIISMGKNGFSASTLSWWIAGLLIMMLKIFIVRRGRAYKYGSWLGIMMLSTWLILIYNHIPV